MTNRTQAETERMIGFFSNLVMLRIDLRGNPNFHELLARVRRVTLEATEHSDIAFEELCADLKRNGIRPPKIQIIFEVKHGEISMPFANLRLRRMERKNATMPWGFQLNVMNRDDGTHGFALFDARVYDPDAVAETIAALKDRMEHLAAKPDEPIRSSARRRRWFSLFSVAKKL
jgi:non-ribosomal peptide synthetase component F